MGVTQTNLIQGPATLYRAPFGSTEPATIATTPAVPWVDMGATQGGIMLEVNDTYSDLVVDQIMYVAGRRRSAREVTVKTVLAEATLANLAAAIGNTDPSTNVLTADDGLAAFNPAAHAYVLDGIAPGGFRRRIVLRKAQPIESVELAYKKDGMTLIPVTFAVAWVSSVIPPFKIEDAVA